MGWAGARGTRVRYRPLSARLAATYLFSRECPSHEEGLDLLHSAAAAAGVELDLEVAEIRTDEEARARRFPGSPTYLVEGRDLFAPEEPAHAFAHDACRAYRRPGGRIGPLPHRDDLAGALRAAATEEPA
jgi:hypothetical protein